MSMQEEGLSVMDTLTDKKRLRQWAKETRLDLDMKQLSQRIRDNIDHWTYFQGATNLLAFVALPGEVDLMPLIHKYHDKHWYLPRMEPEGDIGFYRYHPGDPLENDARFGVPEPLSTAQRWEGQDHVDLVFVPALVLDTNGLRLGFGRGYYDRFLQQQKHLYKKTVCPLPSALWIEELPQDPWDVPVHCGVNETHIMEFPILSGLDVD